MQVLNTGMRILACMLVFENAVSEKTISADLIIQNGTIYTADTDQAIVHAVAVKDDRIIYTGDTNGVKAYLADTTRILDIKGKMALPGLHDVHIHPLLAIGKRTCTLDQGNSYNLSQLIDALAACVDGIDTQPIREGDWITVANFNSHGAGSAEFLGEYPTIADGLDQVTESHKLFLIGMDGHVYAANHYTLENGASLDGIHYPVNAESLSTELSDYAQYFPVTEAGAPTGLIKDAGAYDLFEISAESAASLIDRSDDINRYFLQAGITSAQDAYSEQREIDVFATMAERGNLKIRLSLAIPVTKIKHIDSHGNLDIDKILSESIALRQRFKLLDNLKADTIKVMVDGVMGYPANTAAMKGHYLDFSVAPDGTLAYLIDEAACKPGDSPCKGDRFNYGILEFRRSDLKSLTTMASANSIVVHFHAVGDRAVDAALSAIEAARCVQGDSKLPHNIAHIQIVDPGDIGRFRGVYVTPTYAWMLPAYFYDTTVIPYIDEHQNLRVLNDLYDQDTYYIENAYPVNSIKNAGGILAAGSDAPVYSASPMPFTNIMYGLLRSEWVADPGKAAEELTDDDWRWITMNKNERLSIKTLLDAYTINGAKALRQDDITGSLEIGKKADIVIINQDIIALAADASARFPVMAYSICNKGTFANCKTQVEYTITDGKIVYQLSQ